MSDGIEFTPRTAWGTRYVRHEGQPYKITRNGIEYLWMEAPYVPAPEPKRVKRSLIERLFNFLIK